MANFKTTIITKKGHALMAKLSANVATMKFTKVCSSDFDYSNLNNSELEQVVTFKNLKQTVLPDLIKVVNTTTVKVNATITNTNLTEGYYLRTIGLFALDPDEGEILYSITPTSEADYMAADNGITKSGISLDLLTTISNSENVNLQIDPNATISADTFYNVVGDVAALENEGSNLVDGINKNTTSLNENTQEIENIKKILSTTFSVAEGYKASLNAIKKDSNGRCILYGIIKKTDGGVFLTDNPIVLGTIPAGFIPMYAINAPIRSYRGNVNQSSDPTMMLLDSANGNITISNIVDNTVEVQFTIAYDAKEV